MTMLKMVLWLIMIVFVVMMGVILFRMNPVHAATPAEVEAVVQNLFGEYPPEGKLGTREGKLTFGNHAGQVMIIVYRNPFEAQEEERGAVTLSVAIEVESDTPEDSDRCFLSVVDVGLTGVVAKSEKSASGIFCHPSGKQVLDKEVFEPFGGDQAFYDSVLEAISAQ